MKKIIITLAICILTSNIFASDLPQAASANS